MGDRQAAARITMAITACIALGACQSGSEVSNSAGDPNDSFPVPPTLTLSVLFVGNSLTYYNDLPGTLAGVAAGTGADIRVGMVAGPKLSLTDHLLSGVAATDIRAGGWDIVVLQEGPDADLAARDSLILRTERFDTIIIAGMRESEEMGRGRSV